MMYTTSHQKFWLWLQKHMLLSVCVLLFLLAFGFRFTLGLRQINFNQDQARDAYLMHEFQAQKDIFISYGPKASVGNFYLPPFYYQLNYWFFWLSGGAPLVMQWVTIVVESLTPILLFLLLRLLFFQRAALLGAMVYALSSLVIIYGASAWNPTMIPFFTTLALYCWFHHLLKNSHWTIVVGCLAATIAFHLHYQTIVILPFILIIFFLSLKKDVKNVSYWLLGALLSLVTFLPYIRAEIYSNWQNTRAVVHFFSYQHSQYFDRVSKPAFLLTFIPAFLERVLIKKNIIGLIVGRLLLVSGFVTFSWQSLKSRRKLLLLIYFLSIFLMLRVYKGDKPDYYMSALFILPAVLYAAMSEYLQRWAIIPMMILAIVSEWLIATTPYNNGLRSLDQTTAFITEHTPHQSGRVLIHNPEDINLFAYGFRYLHPFAIDPASSTIVDICSRGQVCASNGQPACFGYQTENDVKAVAVKAQFGYTETTRSSTDFEYQVQIGVVPDKPIQNRYKFYNFNQDYGSDVLLPQLNQY